MLRASFFAGGMFIIMLGISTMFVDKLVLHGQEDSRRDPNFRGMFTSVNADRQHVFDPPDWAGFSLLSVGGITILYSLALPKSFSICTSAPHDPTVAMRSSAISGLGSAISTA